jgi:hypothetical protein
MEFQPRDTSIFLLPIFRQAHPSISSKYFKSPTPKELAIGRRRVEVTFSSSDRNLFRIRFQYLPMTDDSCSHANWCCMIYVNPSFSYDTVCLPQESEKFVLRLFELWLEFLQRTRRLRWMGKGAGDGRSWTTFQGRSQQRSACWHRKCWGARNP